jgi:hypothetical protein
MPPFPQGHPLWLFEKWPFWYLVTEKVVDLVRRENCISHSPDWQEGLAGKLFTRPVS